MTAAYFEDHPTDPEKVILRKKTSVEDDDDIQIYQRPWVGLTLEEQTKLFEVDWDEHDGWGVLYEAIEAKLKEKNT